MTLNEYIKMHGLSLDGFAALVRMHGVDVKRGAVWRWLHGKSRPRPDTAVAIERATCGEVTALSMLSKKEAPCG